MNNNEEEEKQPDPNKNAWWNDPANFRQQDFEPVSICGACDLVITKEEEQKELITMLIDAGCCHQVHKACVVR